MSIYHPLIRFVLIQIGPDNHKPKISGEDLATRSAKEQVIKDKAYSIRLSRHFRGTSSSLYTTIGREKSDLPTECNGSELSPVSINEHRQFRKDPLRPIPSPTSKLEILHQRGIGAQGKTALASRALGALPLSKEGYNFIRTK
ncbi:hypothetical protein OIDMADRAFT_26073 [Oidiodendron maius Zn]|uniref:Uncharacterized protein n=1 Tax=Oidiodendron maius (strain Zn) TaxID=913774 RepID=A0A0C3DMV8_OIDMZ|nr:hypothetical protein OIDMADRAFT_26073 [Oidiodendron maius Zn]